MWVVAFVYMRTLPPRLKSLPVAWLAVLSGMFCNAIVTVANGGFLPVHGIPSGYKPLLATWVPAGTANSLRFLADQHSLYYFSIGDVLIISGTLLWFLGPWVLCSFTRLRPQYVERRVIPGLN
jgi:hypothetical protein